MLTGRVEAARQPAGRCGSRSSGWDSLSDTRQGGKLLPAGSGRRKGCALMSPSKRSCRGAFVEWELGANLPDFRVRLAQGLIADLWVCSETKCIFYMTETFFPRIHGVGNRRIKT